MKPEQLPASVPNRERLSGMLSAVGTSFRSSEAYEAAQKAGFDVSERTLRNDLNEAAESGILERTGSGAWKKTSEPDELRVRIACALLSAGTWELNINSPVNGPTTYERAYNGPEPDELTAAAERYAEALRKL